MSLSTQDVSAIKQVYSTMMQCFLKSDWAGYASAYTDDALFLTPEGDIFQTQGPQSLADWTAKLMQDYGIEQVDVADGIEKIEGDGACAYLYTMETREKIKLSGSEDLLEFKGNSVSLFAKQTDGSWKIKLQIWNKQAVHARFENTKAVIQKSIAALNQGDTSAVKQAIASDYKYYSPSNSKTPLSGEEMLAQLKTALAAFPDLHWQIEAMYAADDWVITRFVIRGTHQGDFMGILTTGNQIEYSSIVICRFKDGRIIEEREELDLLGVMQQLNLELQPKPQ